MRINRLPYQRIVCIIVTMVLLFSSIATLMPISMSGDCRASGSKASAAQVTGSVSAISGKKNAIQTTGTDLVMPLTDEVIHISQKQIDETPVTILIPGIDNILSSKIADTINFLFTITCENEENPVYYKEFSVTLQKGTTEYEIDPAMFGRFDVAGSFVKSGVEVIKSESVSVGVIASEYNFAALNENFPITLFCLSLFPGCNDCITEGKQENPIPTYLIAKHISCINWNKLPEHVHMLPYISYTDMIHSDDAKFIENCKRMKAYIKDLHDLNEDSFFHFYTTDTALENIPWMMGANGIDEDHYNACIISCSHMSYEAFKTTYQGTTDLKKYDRMVSEWEGVKRKAFETGVVDRSLLTEKLQDMDDANEAEQAETTGKLIHYAAAAASADNTIWWVNSNAHSFDLNPVNIQLTTIVRDKLTTEKNVASMLKYLHAAGFDIAFRNLYNFNSDMFSSATAQEKNVMMILGPATDANDGLEDYIHIVQDFYGEHLAYYFKPSFGYPADCNQEREDILERNNIYSLDEMIPTELIMFYFPNISVCGYPSSIFENATSNSKFACGLFGTPRTEAFQSENVSLQTYRGLLDFFASKVDVDNPNSSTYNYRELCPQSDGTDYYVMEFNNSMHNTVAIYDPVQRTITYYDQYNGIYKKRQSAPVTCAPQTTETPEVTGTATASQNPTMITTASPLPVVSSAATSEGAIVSYNTQTMAPAENTPKPVSTTESQLHQGQQISIEDVTYSISLDDAGNTGLVIYHQQASDKLVIKNNATFQNKEYPIVGIANHAFAGANIKKLTLGKNIIRIGSKAFYHCKKLKNIRIQSKSLQKIGKNAFSGIDQKAKFKLPGNKKKKYKKMIKKSGYKNI